MRAFKRIETILDRTWDTMMNGGAIDWKSSKHSAVAQSTKKAEYIAASEA